MSLPLFVLLVAVCSSAEEEARGLLVEQQQVSDCLCLLCFFAFQLSR